MQLSLVELWRATGPIARAVVFLLGAMSVAAGAVAADTWLRLRRAEHATAAFLASWRAAAPDAPVESIAARHDRSPAARTVHRVAAALAGAPAEIAAEVHDRSVRAQLIAAGVELRRGLAVIATVGSTAPFVGLFGTVIGIVNAFHEIGASGRGGIATVSTGIAEALVTTALGILVAIPAVWLFNHLSQRIGRLLATTECIAEEIAVARLVRASGAPSGGADVEPARGPSWR